MLDAKRLLASHASELFDHRGSTEQRLRLRCPALQEFYKSSNGGYFWGRALLIRPVEGGKEPPLSVVDWNEPELWTSLYDGACARTTFFAEDAFGIQFGVKEGRVVHFDPETAALNDCAESIEAWVSLLLGDPAYYTGVPVLAAWEAQSSRIRRGYRLVPKQLFMLGGEFHSKNMTCKPDVEGLRTRAQLWRLTKDLPDGQEIVFKAGE